MSLPIAIIKTLYYIAFIYVISEYMSRTDIYIKDNYPVEDTTLFYLLKERMNEIDKQPFWLYFAFAFYCLSLSSVIDWFFQPTRLITIIAAIGMFAFGVVISLIYSKIKKSPIKVAYEHNDEKGLLSRVRELDGLYNASKYMIFGTFLLCFI